MPLSPSEKDRVVAAALTFVCVLAILLLLFLGGLSTQRRELAQYSMPEFLPTEPEYYEPELLQPSEAPEEESTAPPETSPTIPSGGIRREKTDEPPSNIVTDVMPDFSDANGNPDLGFPATSSQSSSNDSSLMAFMKAAESISGSFKSVDVPSRRNTPPIGADPFTQGIVGTVPGRLMLSCPRPVVEVSRKTIITVAVTVDAEGSVIKAVAHGEADASVRRRCEECARLSQWNAKKGSEPMQGTIIFTLKPS